MLTMMEPAAGEGRLRADLQLGAVTLARHQLGLVLGLGCERIVCLARALHDDFGGLRAATEASGARFHWIAEPRALVGLVSAIDEVIALGDGLLAWSPAAVALLGSSPAVLVQPVEAGVSAGFERLDLNHADAGAYRIPGRLVQRLAELPADCDGFSALQRIALQGGVPQRALPPDVLAQGQWMLVRSEADAHATEAQWIRLQTETGEDGDASVLAAQLAVRRLGPALLHAGSGNGVVAAAAAATALLALVAGGNRWVAVGFTLAALAWLLLCAAGLLARIERETLNLPVQGRWRRIISGWAMDAVLAALMIQNTAYLPAQNLLERWFAPVMLLGMRRLVPPALPWGRWLEDRALLALALAGCGAVRALGLGIDLAAVLLLAAGLYGGRGKRGL